MPEFVRLGKTGQVICLCGAVLGAGHSYKIKDMMLLCVRQTGYVDDQRTNMQLSSVILIDGYRDVALPNAPTAICSFLLCISEQRQRSSCHMRI